MLQTVSHYSDHDSVVSAEWLHDHIDNVQSDAPDYRLVEVDVDPAVYDEWHVPGAVQIDWEAEMVDGLGGDIIGPEQLASLLGDRGITPETTVILYGDKANWFAGHVYWVLRYYQHADVRLLDGGRRYWQFQDYETTTTTPSVTQREYTVSGSDETIRADREEVLRATETEQPIVDVRNPREYGGEEPPAEIPNTTDVQGHVPTAENVPWGRAIEADGRFKPEPALRETYDEVLADEETIAYCRIGERSSVTWFVLSELLDESAVNYDGSWTDWASAPETPVARGEQPGGDGQ